jgi:adenine phosphoribosyltransferase
MNIKDDIRVIEGFPKAGISFKDITTLIKNGDTFKYTIDEMVNQLKDKDIDIIVGPEARGFIVGAPIAYSMGVGFVPVRKPGKLPGDTLMVEYELEYGTDKLEIHKDAIKSGARVAIVDDLLATGGTVNAIAKLVEKLDGKVVGMLFLVELDELNGRNNIQKYRVDSVVNF